MIEFLVFDEVEIFLTLPKLLLVMKLEQDNPSVQNAVSKLRLWSNFWQQNSAIAMNAVVTSHLPVYLYSTAGGKVNRQLLHTGQTAARTH